MLTEERYAAILKRLNEKKSRIRLRIDRTAQQFRIYHTARFVRSTPDGKAKQSTRRRHVGRWCLSNDRR